MERYITPPSKFRFRDLQRGKPEPSRNDSRKGAKGAKEKENKRGSSAVSPGFPIEAFGNDRRLEVSE
jgi:hypothetical protein